MNCNFCGTENEQDVRFCSKCGAKIEQPSQPAGNTNSTMTKDALTSIVSKAKGTLTSMIPMVKSLPVKKILMFGIPAIVILLLAVIILPSWINGSPFVTTKGSISFFETDGTTVVSVDNRDKLTIDGNLYSYEISLDATKAVALVDYDHSNGGTLWYINSTGKTKIAEDVLNYQFSDNGDTIAYATDYESAASASLYLYKVKSKKSEKVTEDASLMGGKTTYVISPDGKTVGFCSDYDGKEYTAYIKKGSRKPETFGDNIMFFAIANNAKYVYYKETNPKDYETNSYVRKGKQDTRLVSNSSYETYYFNEDYSQVLFNYDQRCYISRNGNEREKVSNDFTYGIVMPEKTQMGYGYSGTGIAVIYGIKNFAQKLLHCDSRYILLDKDYEAKDISKAVSSSIDVSSVFNNMYSYGYLADNSRDFVYLDYSSRLRKADLSNLDKELLDIARDVVRFEVSPDGKSIYYVDINDELWFVKGKSKPVKIADDVSPGHLKMSGNRAFFLVDYKNGSGIMYTSKNGGKREKIKGGDDVFSIITSKDNVFFYANYDNSKGTYDVYKGKGNTEFKEFQEGVIITRG